MARELTDRQRRYAEGRAGGLNPVQAAMGAGMDRAGAEKNAYRLEKHPLVMAEMARLAEPVKAAVTQTVAAVVAAGVVGELLDRRRRREILAELARDPEQPPNVRIRAVVADDKIEASEEAKGGTTLEGEVEIAAWRALPAEEKIRRLNEMGSGALGS